MARRDLCKSHFYALLRNASSGDDDRRPGLLSLLIIHIHIVLKQEQRRKQAMLHVTLVESIGSTCQIDSLNGE